MNDYQNLIKQLAETWIETNKLPKHERKALRDFAAWIDAVMTEAEKEPDEKKT